jgi:FkbM family methyltransferase
LQTTDLELDGQGVDIQGERLLPRCEIVHHGVKMIFATPSELTLWRVNSIYDTEPWTLEWISGFDNGDTLLDCGANVGMYTIWAAATRRSRVYAFEPEAQNYAVLNRNITLNGLTELVTAYCVALFDRSGLSTLYMSDLRVGSSCHSVGEALNFRHEPLKTASRQGCVAATLDSLVNSGDVPVPNHIKIDVDGFEPKVIAGARATLAERPVKSLLIETNRNLDDHLGMVEDLNALGFRHDPIQVARAERIGGTLKGIAEYVFRR